MPAGRCPARGNPCGAGGALQAAGLVGEIAAQGTLRPALRRVLSELRRCTGPLGIIVLVVLGTMVLYGVSAWQMSDAIAVRGMAGV